MTEEWIVKTSDLWFTYPDGSIALQGVNFTAKAGEIVVIIGPNGSGKSTLFYHLNGILFPNKGRVCIEGEEITGKNLDIIRQKVGLIFQDPDNQLFAPTVHDDVAFGPRNLGLSKEEVNERVQKTLSILNISHLSMKSTDNLSGGEKRIVSIAGVLAMKPSILVADEPTSNLDPLHTSAILHLFRRLNRELGITLIIATHDVDAVPLYADTLYVMSEGKIAKGGTPQQIFSDIEQIRSSHLRLPRIAHLMEILQKKDGIQHAAYPLTIGEARKYLMQLLRDKEDGTSTKMPEKKGEER